MMALCEQVHVYEYIPSLRQTDLCHYHEHYYDAACTLGAYHPLLYEKQLVVGAQCARFVVDLLLVVAQVRLPRRRHVLVDVHLAAQRHHQHRTCRAAGPYSPGLVCIGGPCLCACGWHVCVCVCVNQLYSKCLKIKQ